MYNALGIFITIIDPSLQQITFYYVIRPLKYSTSGLPLKPLFQGEAKYEAIDIKMVFYSHAKKTSLHRK